MRLVIGVDGQFVYHTFKVPGQKFYFPYRALRDLVEGEGDDVLEMYAPVIRLTPSGDTAEDIARTSTDFHRVRHALEQQGVNVIESPNKLTAHGGVSTAMTSG